MPFNFQKANENAPEAGFAPINYGKLTVEAMALRWQDGQPIRRSLADDPTLKSGETAEMIIKVDIAELNPKLDFAYERSINIQRSGNGQLTDWSEIVLPSLIATYGENWGDAISVPHYVAIEDVENVNGKESKSGKMLRTPKFVAKYADKAACVAAREARFGSGSGNAAPAASGTIPPAVVAEVKSLIQSANVDVARNIAETTAPYNQYNTDVLMALAQA